MKNLFEQAEKSGYTSDKLIESVQYALIDNEYNLAALALEHDKDFQKTKHEHERILEKICKKLGKHRRLMLKLEDLEAKLNSDEKDFIYIQGYIDCMALLRIMKFI